MHELNDNVFGEEGHTADTPTEEMFDRISRENYERLDRKLDESLDSDPNAVSKRNGCLLDVLYLIVGALIGLLLRRLTGI